MTHEADRRLLRDSERWFHASARVDQQPEDERSLRFAEKRLPSAARRLRAPRSRPVTNRGWRCRASVTVTLKETRSIPDRKGRCESAEEEVWTGQPTAVAHIANAAWVIRRCVVRRDIVPRPSGSERWPALPHVCGDAGAARQSRSGAMPTSPLPVVGWSICDCASVCQCVARCVSMVQRDRRPWRSATDPRIGCLRRVGENSVSMLFPLIELRDNLPCTLRGGWHGVDDEEKAPNPRSAPGSTTP